MDRLGQAHDAHQLTRRHFPNDDLAVQQVLRLVYQHSTGHLQTALKFVGLCEAEVLLGAFKALVQLKTEHAPDDKLEMLQLKLSVNELDVGALAAASDDADLHRLLQQVDHEYFRIVVGVVDESMKNEVSLLEQIGARFGPLMLDRMLPDVVQNFCGGNLDEVLRLVEFSRKLPLTSNRCVLVGAVWLQFLHRRQGDSTPDNLMHLWSHARAIQHEKQFPQV